MDEIEILRAFRPVAPAVDPRARLAARAALLEHIERRGPAVVGTRPRSPGWRLTRSLGLALAGLVVLGSLSVAGALKYFGEWGPIDHPATVAQLEEEIADTMAAIPLPSGYDYPVAALRKLAEPVGNMTLFAGVQAVEFHAMCAWSKSWLDGQAAGDPDQMATALAMIEAFPAWQAVADPRLADESVRNEVNEVVAGARADDPAPVQMLFTGLDCDIALSR